MKSKLWSCFAALMLCSCMKVKPKDTTDSATEPAPAVTQHKHLEYAFLPEANANEYQVQFKFKEPLSAVFVEKEVAGRKNSEAVEVHDQIWSDNVKGGEKIIYQFGDYSQNHFAPWEKVELVVPKDLVIESPVDIVQKQFRSMFAENKGVLVLDQYARLFLEKGATLTIQNQNVQIHVQELHSDYATIRTFVDGAKAHSEEDGRSGGTIEIKAALAVGTLKTEMRGEEGGDGRPGRPPGPELNGLPGKPGDAGAISPPVKNGDYEMRVDCTKQPGPGMPGQHGSKGYRGGNGGRGGNSGKILMTVDRGENFTLLPTVQEAGHGGQFGVGGAGGAGGEGGKNGEIPYIEPGTRAFCSLVPGGPPSNPVLVRGEHGPPGDNGQNGPDGVKELSCEAKNHQPKVCY
jgi:hypothetical protein